MIKATKRGTEGHGFDSRPMTEIENIIYFLIILNDKAHRSAKKRKQDQPGRKRGILRGILPQRSHLCPNKISNRPQAEHPGNILA